jgi:hypothetical protein
MFSAAASGIVLVLFLLTFKDPDRSTDLSEQSLQAMPIDVAP